MSRDCLTAERLKELLSYDPETGVFTRKVTASSAAPRGTVAGVIRANGYRVITIDRGQHLAHRLAWLYVHGSWPSGHIDHVDGARDNNAIANLRDLPPAMNRQNLRHGLKGSASALLGVSWDASRGRWRASIMVDGKAKYLGRFHTEEAAHVVYVEAKRKLHPACTI